MAIPMNEMPNRLDQMRADAEMSAAPLPPAGGAPTPSPAGRGAPMPPMPPAGGGAPMPPPPMADAPAPEEDRLAELMGGMGDEPMMPEEDPMADVQPQDLAVGIAQSALDISASPEEALAAVEAAAAELRALLA